MSKKIVEFVTEQVGQPVRLVRGTPDYFEIRKLETEIHGEPVTDYPGEWQNISRERHRDHSRYSYGHESAWPGCMWCEDMRRSGLLIQATAREHAQAERRARRHAARIRNAKIFSAWLGCMLLFTVGPLVTLWVIL